MLLLVVLQNVAGEHEILRADIALAAGQPGAPVFVNDILADDGCTGRPSNQRAASPLPMQ